MSTVVERNVHYDADAEMALLGAVLLSDVAIPRLVIDLQLTAEAFFNRLHGEIWDAMVALHGKDERVDPLTLRAHMDAHGCSDGAPALIVDLAAAAPLASNVLAYARRVLEIAEWRRYHEAAVALRDAVAGRDRAGLAAAEGMLTAVRRPTSDTYGPEALAEAVHRHVEGNTGKAWPTPFAKLNSGLSGGLRAGQVTLLGGWTSMGKSLLTDQLLAHFAALGANVHLYINEMSPEHRALRIVSLLTGVSLRRLMSKPEQLSGEEVGSIVRLGPLPFGITQVTDWTAEDVARDMRFRKWDICALDLVHRLPFREERELAAISRVLNAAAQASGAHLIGVVHLNEERAKTALTPRPVLRDIRGSGMLKNDTDNVLFVHREDEERVDGTVERTDRASLYAAKARSGYLETVGLTFDGEHARFTEVPVAVPSREGWGS